MREYEVEQEPLSINRDAILLDQNRRVFKACDSLGRMESAG